MLLPSVWNAGEGAAWAARGPGALLTCSGALMPLALGRHGTGSRSAPSASTPSQVQPAQWRLPKPHPEGCSAARAASAPGTSQTLSGATWEASLAIPSCPQQN